MKKVYTWAEINKSNSNEVKFSFNPPIKEWKFGNNCEPSIMDQEIHRLMTNKYVGELLNDNTLKLISNEIQNIIDDHINKGNIIVGEINFW